MSFSLGFLWRVYKAACVLAVTAALCFALTVAYARYFRNVADKPQAFSTDHAP